MNKSSFRYKLIFLVLFIVCACAFLLLTAQRQSIKQSLLPFLAVGFCCFPVNLLIRKNQQKELAIWGGVVILLTTVLTWNYMTTAMDYLNSNFGPFQSDSEALVHNTIRAYQENVPLRGFGLLSVYESPDVIVDYISQYGLQGKIFGFSTTFISEDAVVFALQILCSFFAAVVFVVITLLLNRKYGFILAGSFYMTVWLSPWVVNFARNLYWVEFTWFIPMLIGLFCSIYVDKKCCRIISYVGVFLSVLVKCLCGYEYITCIMMAMIAFLLFDVVQAILKKNKQQAWFLFKTAFIMGIAAVFGFVVALLMHAQLRGSGNLLQGLIDIYKTDVMRRMSVETDTALFDPIYTASLQASVFDVLSTYFNFSTSVILGIQGNMFSLLTVLPIFIFVYQFAKKNLDVNDVVMYVFFFLTCISWFVFATPHSYIHTHMNYVTWYFGHVQVCLYVISKQIIQMLPMKRGK